MIDLLANDLIKLLTKSFISEWNKQGHRLTGSFEKSIETQIKKSVKGLTIEFYWNNYANIVDRGVSANKIPYERGSKKRSSKYIDGLTDYVKKRLRVTDSDRARSIAFAIANKQKKEGMSTIKSRRFSKTNKRQGFIEDTVKASQDKLNEIINKYVEYEINTLINEYFYSQ